jgi:hypothetical protein
MIKKKPRALPNGVTPLSGADASGSLVASAFIQRVDLSCYFGERMADLVANDPLGPPTAKDIRRALQALGRAGAPVDLLETLEAWSDG